MSGRLLVAGSGKTARNLGLAFARRGWTVCWVSRDATRLADLERFCRRRLRGAAEAGNPAPDFRRLGDPLPPADAVLECSTERRDEKAALFEALLAAVPGRPLAASNSSSILPSEIHPRCVGLHFFYPVEITGVAEAIVPDGGDPEDRRRGLALVRAAGLEPVEQPERRAFLANRLLLPIQAECLRELEAGAEPRRLDEATVSALLPTGQLELLDAVGLDVVAAAVANYRRRLPEPAARDYGPLQAALERLLALGKRGAKNGDGLRTGAPLPWPVDPARPLEPERFAALFANGCRRALDEEGCPPDDLGRLLDALYGGRRALDEALRPEALSAWRRRLAEAGRASGRDYFRPAPSLADPLDP